jgi:hypothetical protein
MTTFQSQQSDRGRCVHQKADATALQIHVTKCAAKLHGHCHEARKIVRDNFQRATQERVMELPICAKQALPLRNRRIPRLAQVSPLDVRSPARRSNDDRETPGKTSGEISRLKVEPCPGNGRTAATATPPNVRQGNSQGDLRCAGNGCAASTLETCEMNCRTATQKPRSNPRNGQGGIPQDDLLKSQP